MSNRASPPGKFRATQTAVWAAALLLAGIACRAPVGLELVTEIPDSEAIGPAAAGTVAAVSTQTAAAAQGATETPLPPTETETPTLALTATPEPPMARLTGDTNCRTGPLVVYDLIATYRTGKELKITGRSAASDYWYVADPDQPSRECWLWGRYAEVSGDLTAVPVFTPPPTPTPSFDWSGRWTVWLSYVEASMEVTQSGSSITGTLAAPGAAYAIRGTTAEAGREVHGDLLTILDGVKVASFSWSMLDNLQQFKGSYWVGQPPTDVYAYCGTRDGSGQPTPCLWP